MFNCKGLSHLTPEGLHGRVDFGNDATESLNLYFLIDLNKRDIVFSSNDRDEVQAEMNRLVREASAKMKVSRLDIVERDSREEVEEELEDYC